MNKPHDYPTLGADDEKDERQPGVILIDFSDDSKRTAEDCGLWWYIRDWEVHALQPGKPFWFARSGFAIDKDVIKKLASFK